MGGHKPRTLRGECADWLRARIAAGPFTTRGLMAELAARGIKTDRRAVWFFLHAEGLSFKKTVLPAEQSRRDITNMAPLRGLGLRGQRLDARVPHGHWKTLTFIAALRHDRIDAPWVIDGPINGELFATYVEQVLVPTLAAGAHLIFLPAYSPDLNPIEQLFAKLKHLMRAAQPRTICATPSHRCWFLAA